jgi:Rrf2 family protein
MKISAKTDYACRALLQLAMHWPNNMPLQIGIIAKDQEIPMKFLPHILIQLKQLGYVDSIRGKMGGYLLTKTPAQIKLSEVVQSFSENGFSKSSRQKKMIHTIESVWQEIDQATQKHMDSITFEEICNRERNLNEVSNYSI